MRRLIRGADNPAARRSWCVQGVHQSPGWIRDYDDALIEPGIIGSALAHIGKGDVSRAAEPLVEQRALLWPDLPWWKRQKDLCRSVRHEPNSKQTIGFSLVSS